MEINVDQPVRAAGGSTATTTLDVVSLTDRPGLRLVGEVDAATGPVLAAALEPLVDHHTDIHLDLAELSFIDVAGVTALVTVAGRCGPPGRLILHRPPGHLPRMIELLWGRLPGIEMDLT
jgi:anti-anti-sigma factor